MKALTYLLRMTIINYFKRLKQKPQKAIGPVFVVLWFALMFISNGKGQGMSSIGYEYLIAIFTGIVVIMVLYSLYSGTKRLDSKFGMSDVNLIFATPIKPQTVLLYGVVKKMAVELVASIYILYQIPNILAKMNIPVINQIILILAFVIFQIVFCNMLKLFVFALNTKNENLGKIIRLIIKAFIVAVPALTALVFVKGNPGEFFSGLLHSVVYSKWVAGIPVIGWMREITVQVVKGIGISTAFYILLILLVSALMLYITYCLKLDYYEDLLTGAEKLSSIKNVNMSKEAAASGRNNPFMKPFRTPNLNLRKRYGAEVLLFKHINEYMKRSLVFFINTYSVLLFIASVVLGIYVKGLDIKIIFLVSSILLFFSAGMASKMYNEIYHYFIFMLPDTPQRKLFYGMASSLIKAGTDALLLFVPFGIISGTPILHIMLCIICYVLLAGMLSYSGLFAFRIAQFLGFDGLMGQSMLFMFFQMFLAVPLGIAAAILTAGFSSLNGFGVYTAFIIYSIVLAVLFSFGCTGIFKDTEF